MVQNKELLCMYAWTLIMFIAGVILGVISGNIGAWAGWGCAFLCQLFRWPEIKRRALVN